MPLFDYLEVFIKKADDLLSKKSINFTTFFMGMFIKLLYDLFQKNPPLKLRMMDFLQLYLNIVLEAQSSCFCFYSQ